MIGHLSREVKILEIEQDVNLKTQETFNEHMRESVLRERLKTIQKELGELDGNSSDLAEYRQQLAKKKLSTTERISLPAELVRCGRRFTMG